MTAWMTEKALQDILDAMLMEDTMKLLRTLAIYYSPKTKFQQVPQGTYHWYVHVYEENKPDKLIEIPLSRFFGMFVGYSIELDLLVVWQPTGK